MVQIVTACVIVLLGVVAGASAQTSLERGSHTPRGPGGFDMTRRFSGGSQTWDTPAYTVKGSNITPDRETGIGTWSDAEIKRAITDGTHRLGRPISPQMPFPFYKILTPRDLDALVAYLRSIPPVRNEVQPPVYKAAMHAEPVRDAVKPFADDDLRDPVKRGFYLATIAHCMLCHSRRPDGTQDYVNSWGKGGYTFKEAWGEALVPNITSHPKAGVGAWTDAEIKRSLTQGVARDGRQFKQPMARQLYFSRMAEADLDAIVAWMRTLPPLE